MCNVTIANNSKNDNTFDVQNKNKIAIRSKKILEYIT